LLKEKKMEQYTLDPVKEDVIEVPCPDNPAEESAVWNSEKKAWICRGCDNVYPTIESWEEAFRKKSNDEFTKNLTEYITPRLK
jgi:hypothetical protein